MQRFFDERNNAIVLVQFDDTEILRIQNSVGENGGTLFQRRMLAKHTDEPFAVKDVVTENQTHRRIADELPPYDECLCKTFRFWLSRVLDVDSVFAAIAKEPHKRWLVLRRRDNQHVANSGQHQD